VAQGPRALIASMLITLSAKVRQITYRLIMIPAASMVAILVAMVSPTYSSMAFAAAIGANRVVERRLRRRPA